jgi:hypothetical protein
VVLFICHLDTLLMAIEERDKDTIASDLAAMARELSREPRRRIHLVY